MNKFQYCLWTALHFYPYVQFSSVGSGLRGLPPTKGIYWATGLFLRTPFTEGCAGANKKASPPGRHQNRLACACRPQSPKQIRGRPHCTASQTHLLRLRGPAAPLQPQPGSVCLPALERGLCQCQSQTHWPGAGLLPTAPVARPRPTPRQVLCSVLWVTVCQGWGLPQACVVAAMTPAQVHLAGWQNRRGKAHQPNSQWTD